MKKFTTLFAAAILGCGAAIAATSAPAFPGGEYTITPEGQQKMRALEARAKILAETPEMAAQAGEKFYTRSMVRGNYLWDLSILLSEEKINEMVSFVDPSTGKPIVYPFSNLPYYMASILLTARDQDGNYVEYYPFTACWPTKFVYEQIFTYEGDLSQDGTIPENVRDYTPVTFSELANNTTYTNKFQEVTYLNGVGGTPMSIENKFSFWTILENRTGNESCMYEGSYDWVSYVDDSAEDDKRKIGSNFTFTKYEKENNFIKCPMRIYIANISTGVNKNTVRWDYEGTGRVEGFEPTEVTLPSFGDLHLYNAGLGSSEIMGDANPFTEEWGPVTMFYCAIGGEKVIWTQATSGPFTPDAIKNGGIDTTDVQEIDENANAIWGYLYGDAKYANDINLRPKEEVFDIILPTTEIDEILEQEYLKIGPKTNSFVPYGYIEGQSLIAWSEDYSIIPMCHNNAESLATGSRIAWGTKEGFRMQLNTLYKKTINASSVGNIYYHYDPKDISKVEILDSIGSMEWESDVEEVAVADSNISAANGEIIVNAAEEGMINVYTLDGAKAYSVKATAGNTYHIALSKGIYVVTFNNSNAKIAL